MSLRLYKESVDSGTDLQSMRFHVYLNIPGGLDVINCPRHSFLLNRILKRRHTNNPHYNVVQLNLHFSSGYSTLFTRTHHLCCCWEHTCVNNAAFLQDLPVTGNEQRAACNRFVLLVFEVVGLNVGTEYAAKQLEGGKISGKKTFVWL